MFIIRKLNKKFKKIYKTNKYPLSTNSGIKNAI